MQIVELGPERIGDIRKLYEGLSRESIESRFMCPVKDIDSYVDRLLKRNPIMLGAVDGGELIGVTESYPLDDGETAEIAVTVRDDHQGRGIGSALLRHTLDYLARRGFRRAVAYTAVDNLRLIRMGRKFNGKFRYMGDMYEISFDLEKQQAITATA
ncbi:hypothetical protein GCM10007981_12290 [Thermocladium modestius]|uniref:N-acetyltransferase domain-containing protein n=1 Tax=Thermocladium modestius TaxID=62609 RepID=A0A830GWM1_9CREN|nr:GNAT family N-acetyltransferase [Thermocladium modestius]GGP21249.1 hypothetical protein GCM10007981_12290 [Thermocladium modestius]